jgi:proliferating cell nuclear antigen PCNA
MSEDFIFKAKTKEAFVIKILGELVSSILKFASFRINEKGIFLLQPDNLKHQMIEISLLKEYFASYKCSQSISFSVNASHLYKMLKAIKKKDGITLFISNDTDDDLKLGICVEQTDENNKVLTYIPINDTRIEDIEVPTNYENPIIMTSKEFQKLKNLHIISPVMVVTSKPEFIKFFCDGGSIYSRELVIGNENDEDNKHIDITYKQTFWTQYITRLTKCAGQSGNVQVFVHELNGMKIKMKAGGLGEVTIYIKSKEIIEDEEDDENITVIGKEDDLITYEEKNTRKSDLDTHNSYEEDSKYEVSDNSDCEDDKDIYETKKKSTRKYDTQKGNKNK